MVGSGYRLNNFWMAKGVNKEVKRSCTSVLIKTIKYYENAKYTLKKGTKNPHNCHVFKFFT
jgi:hypothetical protein